MMPGFLLRLDSLEEYSALDDKQFGKLIRAGLQFAIDGTEPELTQPESFMWPGLRLKILHDAERYKLKCEQNAKNIRKRWERTRTAENNTVVYDRIRTNTNDTKYNNKNKDNINNINIDEAPKKDGVKQRTNTFIPPTIEEVREYCNQRENGIDPERFVNYYQARGWELKRGQKMKDWKACIRTWESNQKGGNKGARRISDNKTDDGTIRPDYSFLRDESETV